MGEFRGRKWIGGCQGDWVGGRVTVCYAINIVSWGGGDGMFWEESLHNVGNVLNTTDLCVFKRFSLNSANRNKTNNPRLPPKKKLVCG